MPSSSRARSIPCLAVALALAPGARAAELLPDLGVHLKAARYAPSSTDLAPTDLRWDTWIGGSAGVVRAAEATAYFTADVETTIGNERRAFDATQANYHLEAGVRRPLGPAWQGAVVFSHVSRHLSDRPKSQAVDWNVLGVRAAGRLRLFGRPLELVIGVGHTTQDSLVDYRWEGTARATLDVATAAWGSVYVTADGRGVSVEEDERFPRGNFVDWIVEGGVRFPRRGAALDLYAAYERRNDVLLLEPGRLDRALFGFRITGLTGHAAADPPVPVAWP